MIITREQIAAAMRGLGLTYGDMSYLLEERARGDKEAKAISAQAISNYLKKGSPGTDMRASMIGSIYQVLINEGARFEDGWVWVPPGALKNYRPRVKK